MGNVLQADAPADLAAKYLAGRPIHELTKASGLDARGLYRKLAQAGVAPKRLPPTPRFHAVEDDPLTAEIRRLRAEGRLLKDIAKAIGNKSLDYVTRRLQTPSPTPRAYYPPVTEAERDLMIGLCKRGRAVAQIADTLKRSKTTVSDHLTKAGFDLRTRVWHAKGPSPPPKPVVQDLYRGRRYDDVRVSVGNEVAAIRLGQRLVAAR